MPPPQKNHKNPCLAKVFLASFMSFEISPALASVPSSKLMKFSICSHHKCSATKSINSKSSQCITRTSVEMEATLTRVLSERKLFHRPPPALLISCLWKWRKLKLRNFKLKELEAESIFVAGRKRKTEKAKVHVLCRILRMCFRLKESQ